jgi:hypothetical protein
VKQINQTRYRLLPVFSSFASAIFAFETLTSFDCAGTDAADAKSRAANLVRIDGKPARKAGGGNPLAAVRRLGIVGQCEVWDCKPVWASR